MAEHLSNEIIKHYQHKALSAESQFNADIHLATCQSCREKLCEPARLHSLYQSVQSNLMFVREDLSEHLSDEQCVAYVKNQLDEVEYEIVESHLVWCGVCVSEVEEMRAIASQFENRQMRLGTGWTGWMNRIRADQDKGRRSLPAIAAYAGAILIFALAVPFAIWRWNPFGSQERKQIAASVSQTTPLVATEKTSSKVSPPFSSTPALPLNTTSASGPSNSLSWLLTTDRHLFDNALRQGRLEIPKIVTDPGDQPMGLTEKKSFRLLGSGGVVVRETQPIIKWEGLEGASKYRVIVTDISNDRASVADLYVTDTQWQFDKPLERGHQYTWQIIADHAGTGIYGLGPSRNYANIFVMTQDELERVKSAEKHYGASHDPLARIALAARYAKAGLIEDAKRELRDFPKEHAQSRLAVRLLESLTGRTHQQ